MEDRPLNPVTVEYVVKRDVSVKVSTPSEFHVGDEIPIHILR